VATRTAGRSGLVQAIGGAPAAKPAAAASNLVTPALLKRGARGDAVKQLQIRLWYLGYTVDKGDGVFGPKTEAAVLQFQREHGLAADGVVGRKTHEALVAACHAKPVVSRSRAPDPPSLLDLVWGWDWRAALWNTSIGQGWLELQSMWDEVLMTRDELVDIFERRP
jgi:hypothetical protein